MLIRPSPRASLQRPDELLGRKGLKRTLLEVKDAQRNIQINGPRRIGKTWLLRWLEASLANSAAPTYVTVWVPLETMGEASPRRFYDVLRRALARADKELAERCPLNGADPSANGESLIELARALQDEGRRLILLIDEFEKLAARETFDVGFFDQLRALITLPNVSAIVVSALPLREVCHPDAAGSSLWGVFRKVLVGPWSLSECCEALNCWLNPSAPLSEAVAAEALRLTGGWPLAMAELARALPSQETITVEDLRRTEENLAEQLEDEVRQMVERARTRCPGAANALVRLTAEPQGPQRREVGADALDALLRVGLVVEEQGRVRFAWPFTVRILEKTRVGDRARAFTRELPPTWLEWKALVEVSAELPNDLPPRLSRAWLAVAQATTPRDAWFHCRELTDAILTWIADCVPPVATHRDHPPQPFSARRGRYAQFAHIRELCKSNDQDPPHGFDGALGRMVEALSHAEQFGAHHQGHEVSPAESAAFVLLARSALARAGVWRRRWHAGRGPVA